MSSNSRGNGAAKELVCMTCGHELRGTLPRTWGVPGGEEQRGKIRTTVIA